MTDDPTRDPRATEPGAEADAPDQTGDEAGTLLTEGTDAPDAADIEDPATQP